MPQHVRVRTTQCILIKILSRSIVLTTHGPDSPINVAVCCFVWLYNGVGRWSALLTVNYVHILISLVSFLSPGSYATVISTPETGANFGMCALVIVLHCIGICISKHIGSGWIDTVADKSWLRPGDHHTQLCQTWSNIRHMVGRGLYG